MNEDPKFDRLVREARAKRAEDPYTCRYHLWCWEFEDKVSALDPCSQSGEDVYNALAFTDPVDDSAAESWFHSYHQSGEPGWQGCVLKRFENGSALVQLYSWLHGGPTDRVLVTPADMQTYKWFATAEEMKKAGDDHFAYLREPVNGIDPLTCELSPIKVRT